MRQLLCRLQTQLAAGLSSRKCLLPQSCLRGLCPCCRAPPRLSFGAGLKQLLSHPDAPAFLLMTVCMGELMGAQAGA